MKKKLLALLLTLCLSAGLLACSKEEDPPAPEAENPPPVTETTELPLSSKGISDTGFYTDYKALDYVTLHEDYDAVALTQEVATVSEEVLQQNLNDLMQTYATYEELTDRAVAEGDQVNMDYVGYVDGAAFAGGNTQGAGTMVAAGGTGYIDDFLTQIIGHKPGETFDVEVTFPDPYPNNPDLAGKDATFVTTINYIQGELVSPELTDDFVTDNFQATFGFSTVEQLKSDLGDQIRQGQIYEYVVGWLSENSQFEEMPAELMDNQFAMFEEQLSYTAASYGSTVEEMLPLIYGVDTLEEFREQMQESLSLYVGQTMMLQAVAEQEKLTVTEEELIELLFLADQTELESMTATYGLPYLMQNALFQKTMDWLMEHTVVA